MEHRWVEEETSRRFAPEPGFLADRNATEWDMGHPLHGDGAEQAEAVINRFRPRDIPSEVWDRIERDVRQWVRLAQPKGPYDAKALMNVVTQYVVWADVIGVPVDADRLFDPELIDRFIKEGVGHLAQGSQLNYRTQLWQVGNAVRGDSLFPSRPLSLHGKPGTRAPYTEDEIAYLRRWAAALPTEYLRRNCQVVIALGLGAGLRSTEIARAVGADVLGEEEGLSISVIGTDARIVPVVEDWESEILAIAEEVGEAPMLLPHRQRIRRHDMTNLCDQAARVTLGDGPRLTPTRLRNSWIVDRLNAGVCILDVADAAGTGYHQVARYLQYVKRADAASAKAAMRRSP